MSCISSNFSSFFLDSLNDPSEFAKYLSNGDNRMVPIVSSTSYDDYNSHNHQHHHHNFHHHQQQNGTNGLCDTSEMTAVAGGANSTSSLPYNLPPTSYNHQSSAVTVTPTATASEKHHQPPTHSTSVVPGAAVAAATGTTNTSQNSQHFDGSFEFLKYLRYSADYGGGEDSVHSIQSNTTNSSLIDLDSTPTSSHKGGVKRNGIGSSNSNNNFDLDSTYDHDSKHNIFDLHHQNNSCSSTNNSDSMMTDPTILAPHLSASNSNPSSECGSDNSNNLMNNNNNVGGGGGGLASISVPINPKALMKFVIKENFDVHPSHKVEEGIFQHMNKLPIKKKEQLKSLGVTFTGHMSISDKSIIVDNFTKFCQEYSITDHRPFLALNQCGMLKPEQIKFARYLGQGLPTFTLFCIYSNFKNLFCLKRFENYTKGSYDLQYILDKTKRFISCTNADLKSITQQHHQTESNGVESTPPSSTNSSNNNNQHPASSSSTQPSGAIISTSSSSSSSSSTTAGLPPLTINSRPLDELRIFENYDVHETHRIEDGIFTHMARLSPKKQELLKQFGIQSNHNVTYYEKYVIIENFIKFCNEYKIMDHRPFLDFHDSGMPKSEQIKFARFLGQGLPNLTLYKIYLAFKDVLALNRIEKITVDGYNLDVILKKKKKNLYNRMHAAVHRESTEASKQAHRESLAS